MNKVIVILGPTGVGKTKLSVEIAKRVDGEIINADSTQVYRNLNIATAKIKEEEKENIPHHLFDIQDMNEEYSVYQYQKDCREKIEDIFKRGKTPILVGGTGLYIKAALYDYEFCQNEKKDYSNYSTEELYKKLKQVDPKIEVHPNNRQRIENALSFFENTNTPFSDKKKSDKLLYPCLFLGLTTDREVLYERINRRVEEMVKDGLLEEAKQIYQSGIRSKAVMTPIGYKELFPYFEEKKNLIECLNSIKQKSRNYAKRQYTWNRHQFDIDWFFVDFQNFEKTIEEIMTFIQSNKKKFA